MTGAEQDRRIRDAERAAHEWTIGAAERGVSFDGARYFGPRHYVGLGPFGVSSWTEWHVRIDWYRWLRAGAPDVSIVAFGPDPRADAIGEWTIPAAEWLAGAPDIAREIRAIVSSLVTQ